MWRDGPARFHQPSMAYLGRGSPQTPHRRAFRENAGMTIASTTVANSGSSTNGATTQFSFAFHIADYGDVEAEDQIVVRLVTTATGAETVLTRGASAGQYSVSINADQSASPGGSITTITTYASGYKIWIELSPSFLQATDYQNQGAFLMETVEDQADQHTRQILVLKDQMRRALHAGVTAGASFSGSIDGPYTPNFNVVIASDGLSFALSASLADATVTAAWQAIINQSTVNAGLQSAGFPAGGVSGAFSGHLYGLTLSNGSDATNDINIAAGSCIDSTNAYLMTCGAMTKQLDANWATGTNQGMRYSGAAIANTTYGIWAAATADGVEDFYAYPNSGGPSAATVLAALNAETGGSAFAYVRRIGFILRESGAIVAFVQSGDNFVRTDSVADIAANNPGTSAVSATLKVPIGEAVDAVIIATIYDASPAAATNAIVTALTQTDFYPSSVWSCFTPAAGAGVPAGDSVSLSVRTNASAQVRYRLSASNGDITFYISTHGWRDTRGRLAT